MNTKSNNLLRYLLIVLLMFAPTQGVFVMPVNASQVQVNASHCDMSAMPSTTSMQHMLLSQPGLIDESHQSQHECCCDTGNCAGNCGMGMTVSLLIQISSYSPVFVNTEKSILSSVAILHRVLSPPSRPPLIVW